MEASEKPARGPGQPAATPMLPDQATLADRLMYLLFSLAGASTLVVARLLVPSSAGHGTHQQLGMPPCTFKVVTGHGCPGCGLTTSFAHMARGQIVDALSVNPIGPLFFGITACVATYCGYRAIRPVPIDNVVGGRWFTIAAIVLVGIMFVSWIVRLLLGVA